MKINWLKYRNYIFFFVLSAVTSTVLLFQACGKGFQSKNHNQSSRLGGTPTPASSPTPNASPSPQVSPTPHPTPSPSPTQTPTPSPLPSPSQSPTPTPRPSPSPSPTPRPSPSPTPQPTPSPLPSPQPSPPQPNVNLNSFNNCAANEIFTYPYILQSDWQEPNRSSSSFTVEGFDTARLYWDSTSGSKGTKYLLPNSYAVSNGFYFTLMKFGYANSGSLDSHNFELMRVDQERIWILYEIEKSATADRPWYRHFRQRGTPQNQSNLEFLKKCVRPGVIMDFPASGPTRFAAQYFHLDKSNYTWVYEGENMSGETLERNIYSKWDVPSQSIFNQWKQDPTKYISQDGTAAYPLDAGALLYNFHTTPASIIIRSNWWNAGGDIFERYYYALNAGPFYWQWLERVTPVRGGPNNSKIQHLFYSTQADGTLKFYYKCLLDAGGTTRYVDFDIPSTADQQAWRQKVDQAMSTSDLGQAIRVMAPNSGVTSATMRALGDRKANIHLTVNHGYLAFESSTRQYFVTCHVGGTSNPKYGVKYKPNLLADPRSTPANQKLLMEVSAQHAP